MTPASFLAVVSISLSDTFSMGKPAHFSNERADNATLSLTYDNAMSHHENVSEAAAAAVAEGEAVTGVAAETVAEVAAAAEAPSSPGTHAAQLQQLK